MKTELLNRLFSAISAISAVSCSLKVNSLVRAARFESNVEETGQGNADGAGNLEIRKKAKPGAKGNSAKASGLFASSGL